MDDNTNSTDLTGYINDVSKLGGTATGLLSAIQGKPTSSAAAAPAASASSWTKYLPYIIGGGVLLLVLAIVLGRK